MNNISAIVASAVLGVSLYTYSAQADQNWISSQKMTLSQIEKMCTDPIAIEKIANATEQFAQLYLENNKRTTLEATEKYASRTLHGAPFDQNRLGKIGEREQYDEDGSLSYVNEFAPGFENFYIAGSQIVLPKRTYDIMQAPLVARNDKVDTVLDFWDTVVVLRKSPIIITTHDPKEKIPTKGYAERAEYWTADRFVPYMQLRGGWQLYRKGGDKTIATSKHSKQIALVKRSFIAKHPESGQEHEVTQFHYQGWPDRLAAPDFELLERAHQEVENEITRRALTPDRPITVHCAAGKGRSPSFAISNYLRLELLEKVRQGQSLDEITLNVVKTIYDFKIQRPLQVREKEHWCGIFNAIRRVYLQQRGMSNDAICTLERKDELITIAKGQELLKQKKGTKSKK